MFNFAYNFNQPIGAWNTTNVTDMCFMFTDANNFNQPLGTWNTSNVTCMRMMFKNATVFNQPLGNWNTSNVQDMAGMFAYTNFNQPLNSFNTSQVKDFNFMFEGASSFNQPIMNFDIQNAINLQNMFDYSGLDCANYSSILGSWNNNAQTPNSLILGAVGMYYDSASIYVRNNLINNKWWIINGDSLSVVNCHAGYYFLNLNHGMCQGDTFLNYSSSGVYFDTIFSTMGPDTLRYLNLYVAPQPLDTLITRSLCQGSSYLGYNTTGIYIDTLTNYYGCQYVRTLDLTILPLPTPILQQLGVLLIVTNPTPGSSYTWYYNNQPIPGWTTDTIPVSLNGFYKVKVTNTNNCVGYDTIYYVNLGTKEYEVATYFNVYPNQAKSLVNLDIPILTNNAVEISLSDMQGRILYRTELKNQPKGICHHQVDFQSFNLSDAVYMLTVSANDKIYTPVKLLYSKE